MTSSIIETIEDPADLFERTLALYKLGLPRGSATGWRDLTKLYTVASKQWTLITGIPGHGKSELLDALLVNLAEEDDWHFAFYSPENYPTQMHTQKLLSKHLRLPFADGPTVRMTEREMTMGMVWVSSHFVWLNPSGKDYQQLLAAAQPYRHRGRKFGVILDPWNQLEHLRPRHLSETEYVSMVLTDVTAWCRDLDMHVFIVAHPAKMMRDSAGERPVPTPYDIAGSAHWFNKADNILAVHRKMDEKVSEVDVHVQKVRFKNIGRVGVATLRYNIVTGRYDDMPRKDDDDDDQAFTTHF